MRKAAIVSFVTCFVFFAAACGGKNDKLHYTLASLDAAMAGVQVHSESTQNRIVADPDLTPEQKFEKVAAYRAKRDKVVAAFVLAYSGLAALTLEYKAENLLIVTKDVAEAYKLAKQLIEGRW